MRREALAMSGVESPSPAQKSFRPPPEPVLSTMGVLKETGSAELLGYGGREGEYGGRSDDADLIAGDRRTAAADRPPRRTDREPTSDAVFTWVVHFGPSTLR